MDIQPLSTRSSLAPLRSLRPSQPSSRRPSRAELVAQVDDFLRDNINEPVTVGDLSRMAGVSERTLRSAHCITARAATDVSPLGVGSRKRRAERIVQASKLGRCRPTRCLR